ncbi:MAG: C1 family peptidase, partial [Pirellulales bacterium]|nr:C1 family peptidase [Pirellulales bacterium]
YGSVQCDEELCEHILPKGCDSFDSYMQTSSVDFSDLPDSIDWRTENAVTPTPAIITFMLVKQLLGAG